MPTLRPHQERIIDRMLAYEKGQIIVPTGGGKTMCMIMDTQRRHDVINNGTTTVVVAPRILLAEQLCSEFLEVIDTSNTHIMHVHSGETHHFSSTKSDKIHLFATTARTAGENVIIFTSYNSLQRIVDADIEVNTIYFDEAHNSVKRNFFPPTEFFSYEADRCYFFTATRKTSVTINKPGMNDEDVYGQIIARVSAPELVEGGYIIPPRIQAKKFFMHKKAGMISCETDAENVIDTIEETDTKKILVCVKTSRQLINLMSATDFAMQLAERGYSCLYITSKTGAVVDGKKVNREQFFNTLNAWGRDDKKFVIMHHSILSEGINVKGLDAVMFMRNMDYIGISQSIGRVIRLGGAQKTFGLVCVPVADKVGISTARSVQAVVDTVFEQGEPAVSIIRR